MSSITAPRSPDILSKHGITHVLSLTSQRDRPQIAEELGIQQLHLEIEDNPFEDLLMSLDGICAWIDDALSSGRDREIGVLVHCLQGISRSGAIIVAYLMRTRSIDYDAAFNFARKSRSLITPNSGFAEQLRLWQQMGYTIYEKASEGGEENGAPKMKQQYEEWKANRGILLSKGEEAKQQLIRKSMADMAARFGRQRIELKEKNEAESSAGQ
ncbi:dual specificity phosphatase [Lojkania enalia]|uniref:protein-tyrosine-phosphatase n=1 Tax=Lojkania enalia TaxID=147567 RepID=A0A9P4N705_9PLEO|nr:dual specificity phosphatase [Didymosphaeria enalia]